MKMADLPAIAVIADAHFHDIDCDYGINCTTTVKGSTVEGSTVEGKRLTLRSWKDTRRSSRVFNESKDALTTALTDIEQRGIRHVVLLGDYTDDGQIESTRLFANLVRNHKRKYGMAFYAIPGNHDFYGPVGKHQSTRFVTQPGESVLVTSDPEVAATENNTSVLTQNMYCEGLPEALLPMADFGLFKQPEYIHWETPFGQSDSPESRMFDATSADRSVVHSLMDSSYLVEPCEGLWLLMIDANVYEPRNGRTDRTRKNTFFNSSNAGWNSVLEVKPFLIEWVKDVCARAESSGKHLLAFSHYPIVDTIDTQAAETRLFGNSEVARRTPDSKVVDALLATGLRLHFSGHMHVNSEAHVKKNGRVLSNIAVPSLVGFPAAYKIIQPMQLESQGISQSKSTKKPLKTTQHVLQKSPQKSPQKSNRITTIPIDSMPIDPALIKAYCAENKVSGNADEKALGAKTYGDFLYKKMHTRVEHYFLKRDWPEDIACQIGNTTAIDLAYLLLIQKSESRAISFGPMQSQSTSAIQFDFDEHAARYHLTRRQFESCSMMSLITDWYRLRLAGPLAGSYVSTHEITLYTCLADIVTTPAPVVIDTHAAFFRLFLSVFKHSIESLNSSMSPTEIEL